MIRNHPALLSSVVVVAPSLLPLLGGRRPVLRAVALGATALTTGLSMAHALEMPAKRRLPPSSWWSLATSLYRPWFGRAGHVEGMALVAVPTLAIIAPSSRGPATAAAGALLLANPVLFLWLVAPTNRATLRPGPAPQDAARLRDRWEWGHLLRFCCHLGALTALVVETSGRHVDDQRTR